MKTASRILYVVSVIFAAINVVLLVGLCVFCIVNANNTDLINWIGKHIIEAFQIEEQYQQYVYSTLTGSFIAYGVSFAISAIPSVIAIPVFLNARKGLDDITNTSIATFVASIIFGVLSTDFGIAAGVLAIVERARENRHKRNSKVVSEQ